MMMPNRLRANVSRTLRFRDTWVKTRAKSLWNWRLRTVRCDESRRARRPAPRVQEPEPGRGGSDRADDGLVGTGANHERGPRRTAGRDDPDGPVAPRREDLQDVCVEQNAHALA